MNCNKIELIADKYERKSNVTKNEKRKILVTMDQFILINFFFSTFTIAHSLIFNLCLLLTKKKKKLKKTEKTKIKENCVSQT